MRIVPSSKSVAIGLGYAIIGLWLGIHSITSSVAMDWQLNQSISAGLTFSDNVNLDPDNQKEEGVTPTSTYTIVGTGQSGRDLVATDARI